MLKGIKIVSDGSICGTRVYDSAGVDVTEKLHIRGIQWSQSAGGVPTAILTCSLAAIESYGTDAEYTADGFEDVSTLASTARQLAPKKK